MRLRSNTGAVLLVGQGTIALMDARLGNPQASGFRCIHLVPGSGGLLLDGSQLVEQANLLHGQRGRPFPRRSAGNVMEMMRS